MSHLSIDQETWQLGIDLFKAKHEEEMSNLDKRERYFQNKVNSFNKHLKELVRMRADQELTKDEFLDQKQELLNDRKDAEEKLGDNQASIDSWLELCTKYLNTAFSARETMTEGEPEEKRNLILDVGQNLILKDGKLQFSFKEPYNVLLLPEYRSNVLPVLDSNQNKQLQRLLSYR